MNREQKASTIDALAADIQGAEAIFAVDYRGLSVPQAAELRSKLRDADAAFKVVKNSLTERAADQAGAEHLKALLSGPTALTFVRGDAALAAKAIADYARATQLLPFKGGVMDGQALDAEQIRSISRLPSREVLYGQLVGVVASPVSGLVRTLGALVGGLAVALGQVREKKESGEIPAGEAPAEVAAAELEQSAPEETPESPAAEQAPSEEPAAEAAEAEAPAEEAPAEAEPAAESGQQAEPAPSETEDKQDEPAQEDDKQADVSAQSEDAETNPTKED